MSYTYSHSDQLYITWRGASSNKIWYSTFNGSEFTNQQVVAGSDWTAESSAAPTFQQSTALFWKGVSKDIWETPLPSPSWTTQYQVTCDDPGFTAETSTSPAATLLFAADGTSNSFIYPAFWKGDASKSIWYSYSKHFYGLRVGSAGNRERPRLECGN